MLPSGEPLLPHIHEILIQHLKAHHTDRTTNNHHLDHIHDHQDITNYRRHDQQAQRPPLWRPRRSHHPIRRQWRDLRVASVGPYRAYDHRWHRKSIFPLRSVAMAPLREARTHLTPQYLQPYLFSIIFIPRLNHLSAPHGQSPPHPPPSLSLTKPLH